jgi:hypothetical protein
VGKQKRQECHVATMKYCRYYGMYNDQDARTLQSACRLLTAEEEGKQNDGAEHFGKCKSLFKCVCF